MILRALFFKITKKSQEGRKAFSDSLLADIVEIFEIPLIKITSGQRIALIGMEECKIEPIYDELDMDPGKATEFCLHQVY